MACCVVRELARRLALALPLAVLVLALFTACNAAFDIHEGTPRPVCAEQDLIDDMEDGNGSICKTGGRDGTWYAFGDGTIGAELTPMAALDMPPTLIADGPRGTSRYAARFQGSGFRTWGAIMGLNLSGGLEFYYPYDASGRGGVKFWMKSNTRVDVDFPNLETVPVSEGGDCEDGALDCNDHFSFSITAPAPGWKQYEVPFNALRQRNGSATWNPHHLMSVNFRVPAGAVFDVWVDDVRFYICPGPECEPTCTDPAFPQACRAGSGPRSSCQPEGTDCATLASRCAEPLMIDDLEDGDATICDVEGRNGGWYTFDDETSSELVPRRDAPFVPDLIPGGRGSSLRAAHLTGSGFQAWGAGMGLNLNYQGDGAKGYDASQASGIRFWAKSTAPISVAFPLPATTPTSQPGGKCVDRPGERNCNNHFELRVGPTHDEWVEYTVPFSALRQWVPLFGNAELVAPSARWDASQITSVDFVANYSEFDVWVDDIRFYSCPEGGCVPSCSAEAPVACPASGTRAAQCWPEGTDCARPELWTNLAVWGSGSDDVWIVGVSSTTLSGRLRHWNGSEWFTVPGPQIPGVFAVWGSEPNDVWAVADRGSVLHWNGSAWLTTTDVADSVLFAVWGSGPRDVWAIQYPGTLLHWDGAGWSRATSVAQHLNSVWGSGANDVWAVGDAGTILHWDGSVWESTTSGTRSLYSVWGSGPNDAWAVGPAGTVLHWDGSEWAQVESGTGQTLVGVWAGDRNDVWVVGDLGTTLHWDGSAWTTFRSGTDERLTAVWGSGSEDVWAVGDAGTVLHWNGEEWAGSPR